MGVDEDHSPVYKTLQALEDDGLHVAVAFHTRRGIPGGYFIDQRGISRIDEWASEAFKDGAEWVSVVVVSDRPVKERLTEDERPSPD